MLNELNELVKLSDVTLTKINVRDLYPSFSQLIERSLINIDKPRGPSSHEVTAWVAKMVGAKK